MIKLVKLGEICNVSSAGDKPSDFTETKTAEHMIPVIANGIEDDGVIGYTIKPKISRNAVTVSARGNIGTAFYRNYPYYPVIRLITAYPKNDSELDCRYLYYLLKNSPLKSIGSSVQAQLTVPIASDVDLFIEDDYSAQRSIATFLGVIDDKISTNNKIIETSEKILCEIFDFWFAQFDFPDENGCPYRSSGGKMIWNEELKREIPEEWEVASLKELISSSKNGDWGNGSRKKDDDIEVTCFRGADFASITTDYQVTAPTRYIKASNANRLLSAGDLVTEISGGSPSQATGRIGYITQKFIDRNGGLMDCSNFCKAFTPKEAYYQFWLYHIWKSLYDAGVMFNYESKTTGIKNLMYDEFIAWIKTPVPPASLLERFQNICTKYYDQIQNILSESAKLAELRDWLLPMLMNGQVKIKD